MRQSKCSRRDSRVSCLMAAFAFAGKCDFCDHLISAVGVSPCFLLMAANEAAAAPRSRGITLAKMIALRPLISIHVSSRNASKCLAVTASVISPMRFPAQRRPVLREGSTQRCPPFVGTVDVALLAVRLG